MTAPATATTNTNNEGIKQYYVTKNEELQVGSYSAFYDLLFLWNFCCFYFNWLCDHPVF